LKCESFDNRRTREEGLGRSPQDAEPWYGAFRDVWTAHSSGNWSVTFQATGGTQGTRVWMVDGSDTDVYVSKSPAPFRTTMPADTAQAF
jgi:hypothetical protein